METNYNHTWSNRALLSIAQEGALTNSKRPSCLVKGVYPTHFITGEGCKLKDVDGKEYIDYICALGTCILGYGNDKVGRAMNAAMQTGAVFSLGSATEILFAEKIKEICPFVDMIKILKSGSSGCSAAITIARAYQQLTNNRGIILSAGYHGHDPEFVSLTPPAHGIVMNYPIEKFHSFDQIGPDIAAVIIEPFELDGSEERMRYLHQLREVCTKNNVLLIYDETITAMRVPRYTVAMYSGATPDLIVFGKALANGMPISIVGGKKEIMESCEYFISTTFAGERVTLSAAIATIETLQTTKKIPLLWDKAHMFQIRFNALAPSLIQIKGYPTRGTFVGEDLIKAIFWQEACKAGILFGPSWFYNFEHFEVMEEVLDICGDILTKIKNGKAVLQGEMPRSPFAAKVRQQ